MNEQTQKRELKPLLFALLTGFCGNASIGVLFNSHVAFSVFPLIAFGFSIYCLYQRYVSAPLQNETPLLSGLSFLFGILAYSAVVRVEYPQIGSNFVPVMLCMVLVLGIVYKMGKLGHKK